MARRALVATVGSSPQPLIESVATHEPEFIVFLCTASSKTAVAGILQGAQRSDVAHRMVEIGDPDSLSECYALSTEAIEAALAENPNRGVIVDYTGGTKTMSAALVLGAASSRFAGQVRIYSVGAQRTGSSGVVEGTQNVRAQDTNAIVLEDQWRQALDLANGYHYASADVILRRISREGLTGNDSLRSRTQVLSEICRSLDAWDRFDHAAAYPLLGHTARLYNNLKGLVASLLGNLRLLEPLTKPGAVPPVWDKGGVLLVYDLLNNAARRGAQGRFDDAVARLYRSLELLAQARLNGQYGLVTANVAPEKAADWLAIRPDRSGQQPLRIGLRDSYEVLDSKQDPLGKLYRASEGRLLAVLTRRNASCLAHGMQPITRVEYEPMYSTLLDFVNDACEKTGMKLREPEQFPELRLDHFT